MPSPAGIDSGDLQLVQIIDAALAEAARRAGRWLACRRGCTACCMAPFAITQLDARRLRRGLGELEAGDPQRAARVRQRARQAVSRLAADFPGDPATGVLFDDDAAEERFATFGDNEPCPALDRETGCCDLYAARPVTCRTFGPPVRCGSESVAVCELCFEGATDAEIAACEIETDPGNLECALLEELEETTDARGQTIVAFALGL